MSKTISDWSGAWADDDSFWEAMAPALSTPDRLSLADRDAEAILSGLGIPVDAKVLDLGCGAGGHAVALAARGNLVTAVDRSASLLELARTHASTRGVSVEWVLSDMRTFRRPGVFDLVCSLYTSFGFFNEHQNRQVLENIIASLKPDGVIVMDVTARETVARGWRERQWLEVDGVLYLEKRHVGEDWSALYSDWVVIRDCQRRDFRVRQRLYSGAELRDLLSSVGFVNVALFGALGGTAPYDESATRLVATARAPKVV